MPAPGDNKCVNNNQYTWQAGTPPGIYPEPPAPAPGQIPAPVDQLSEIVDILNVIAARMPGGAAASTSYRYVEEIIDPRRNDYLVTIGVPARNFNLRYDQPIKLRLGSVSNDQIFMDPTESPFEVLNFAIDIDEIYITTYANSTRIKILAW